VAAALVAAAALLIAAGRDGQRRAWAWLAIAGGVLFFALRELPLLFASEPLRRHDWNWSGHLAALGGLLGLTAVLSRRAGLGAGDFGFGRPAQLGLAAAVTAAALAVAALLHLGAGGRLERIPASTWLFVAVMPGLVEEIAFRGVLLAAAERAAPAARRVAGVPVSAGAALLTAAFVGLHGVGPGTLLSVLPGALLYLWLRLKTGSVWPPVVAHNLWNLVVLATHLERQG
jgi:membrane protease YdiL (CAAX protease family)